MAEKVFDLPPTEQQELKKLLTFNTLPNYREVSRRAAAIANLVKPFFQSGDKFMVGGAPYLMQPLWQILDQWYSAQVVYAFTERVSVEDPETGVKTSVFKHAGWVPHYGSY